MSKPTGYVLYEGPSQLDGITPIVAILTVGSGNRKTGDMAQTWILRQDIEPHTAVTQDMDAPVCGTCPLRAGQGCYVTVCQAPLTIYRAWKRGRYPHLPMSDYGNIMGGRKVRLGAYGDPLAVPYCVMSQLAEASEGSTGYTHQWRSLDPLWAARWAQYVMASVHGIADSYEATVAGWRVFGAGPQRPTCLELRDCPSAATDGRVHCETCLGCGGKNGRGRNDGYWLPLHGSRVTRALAMVG